MLYVNFEKLKLSTFATNQKPNAPGALAEVRREFYMHRLAKWVVIAVILGLLLVLAWSVLVPPRFDEAYVKSLLGRHDPSVRTAEFTAMAGEDELNRSLEESVATDYFSDDVFGVGTRTASLSTDENGTVLGGELVVVRSVRTDIGPTTRAWRCPDGSWMNISEETTPNYIYLGATGSAFTVAAVKITEEDTGIMSALDQIIGLDAGAKAKAEPVLASVPLNISPVQIFYFGPEERDEYDFARAGLLELVEGCEEVV